MVKSTNLRKQFPRVMVGSDGRADVVFLDTIRSAANRMLRNADKVLPRAIRQILKTVRKGGWRAVPFGAQRDVTAFCLLLCDHLYGYLPDQMKRPAECGGDFPLNHFMIYAATPNRIVVWGQGLDSRHTSLGRVYLPVDDHRSIEWKGKRYRVAWTRHAATQMHVRSTSGCNIHAATYDVFARLSGTYPFTAWATREDADLPYGVCIWDPVAERTDPATGCRFFAGRVVQTLLGRESRPGELLRVGYGPAVIEDDLLIVKTFLRPGYSGTPEYRTMVRLGFSAQDLRTDAIQQNWWNLAKSQDFGWLKQFHDYAVPQVCLPKETVG